MCGDKIYAVKNNVVIVHSDAVTQFPGLIIKMKT